MASPPLPARPASRSLPLRMRRHEKEKEGTTEMREGGREGEGFRGGKKRKICHYTREKKVQKSGSSFFCFWRKNMSSFFSLTLHKCVIFYRQYSITTQYFWTALFSVSQAKKGDRFPEDWDPFVGGEGGNGSPRREKWMPACPAPPPLHILRKLSPAYAQPRQEASTDQKPTAKEASLAPTPQIQSFF